MGLIHGMTHHANTLPTRGDIRTEVTKYAAYHDGVLVDEPTDLTADGRDDW